MNQTDAVLYKTTNNRGGAITANKVINNALANFFSSVSLGEALLGSEVYWGGYLQNDNPAETGDNFILFIDPNTEHPDDEVQVGLDPAGINATMQTIASNTSPPVGVTFSLSPTPNQGVFVGTLKPGERIGFWLKRILHITREEKKQNSFGINILFDPPLGSSGGGSGSGGGTGGGGGGTPGPAPGDFDVAWVGDMGTSSGTKATIDNILSFNVPTSVVVGDIAYQSTGDKWVSMSSQLRANGKKQYWCPGNHEYSDGKGLIAQYKQVFGTGAKTFYSFTIGNMFVIAADMYVSFKSGSEQYNFVKGEMERIKNNSSILWRVLIAHEPLFGSKSKHSNNPSFRDVFFPLMNDNGFDLYINGHNHHYERTYPLKWDSGKPATPIVMQQANNPNYTNPGGVIEITTGLGGHDIQYKFSGSRNSWSAFGNDSTFGFFMTSISNGGKTLTGKGYSNSGHALFDSFTINK
jgi:hypothetical protein